MCIHTCTQTVNPSWLVFGGGGKGIAVAENGKQALYKNGGYGVTVIFNGGSSFLLSSLEREEERQRCLEYIICGFS